MDYLKTLRPYGFFSKITQGKYSSHGISDIIGCYHGQFVSFEVKAPNEGLTPLQKAFINNITLAKGKANIVRSLDDVKAIIQHIDKMLYRDK